MIVKKNILCSEYIAKDPKDNEEEGSKGERKMGKKQLMPIRSCRNFKANMKTKAVKNSVLF